MHIYVSTVCTIGPSFFNTTSVMYRRPFDGRHLVLFKVNLEVYGAV